MKFLKFCNYLINKETKGEKEWILLQKQSDKYF